MSIYNMLSYVNIYLYLTLPKLVLSYVYGDTDPDCFNYQHKYQDNYQECVLPGIPEELIVFSFS